MLSKILKPGDRLIMKGYYPVDGEYKRSVGYHAELIELTDEHNIRISEPEEEGRPYLPEGGERYEIRFIASQGGFDCKGEIMDCIGRGGKNLVDVRLLTELQGDMRRKYIRVDKVIPMTYVIVRGIAVEGPWDAVISNISGGGMRFSAETAMERDTIIESEIMLDELDAVPIIVRSRVIYAESAANMNVRYEHRAEFIDVSSEVREKLVKFVFKEERKQRIQKM